MERRTITVPWASEKGFSTSCFIASVGAVGMFKRRTILSQTGSALWSMGPLCANAVPVLAASDAKFKPEDVKKDLVYIVSGESGSGKTTWALMTSDLGIYVTAADLKGALEETNRQFARPATDALKDERNEYIVQALCDAVKKVLGGFFTAPFKDGPPVTMSLVLDEFGEYPAFVRGLCASSFDDVRSRLRGQFSFEVNLKLIVVGTGTDAKSNVVGSLPGTCVALRMPSTPMMAAMERVLNNLGGTAAAATLVEALKSHAQAVHLTKNPRFAACLLKRLVDYYNPRGDYRHDQLFPSVEAAFLDAHLFAAARDFKQLNAMSRATREDVADYYTRAIGMILRKPEDGRELEPEELELLTTVGVVTDLAFYSQNKCAGHVEVDGSDNVSLILLAPKTGRYAMSMAQQLLFRMGYGFDAFETAASWQRYEIVISEYVSVLLSGLNGHA
ncbi:Hypothetical protein, putative [Bodo saltans]|uniref:Uncharacterized protein n=1 Tax=Bodo saltans TaxID=75058 RepID=A0A0S4IJ59_BODSA|nr:Hypothetical protein, putative [Bodo saltans]|eukprot:CUE75631.1 Hypothetical protein, putative [Bodo saltans]